MIFGFSHSAYICDDSALIYNCFVIKTVSLGSKGVIGENYATNLAFAGNKSYLYDNEASLVVNKFVLG